MSMFDNALKIINTPLDKNKKDILLDRLKLPDNLIKNYKCDDKKRIENMMKENEAKKYLDQINSTYGLNITKDDLNMQIIQDEDYIEISKFKEMISNNELDYILIEGIILDFITESYYIIRQGDKYNAILLESQKIDKVDNVVSDKYFLSIKELSLYLCGLNDEYECVRIFEDYVAYACDIGNDDEE